jgi:hypothetical protein
VQLGGTTAGKAFQLEPSPRTTYPSVLFLLTLCMCPLASVQIQRHARARGEAWTPFHSRVARPVLLVPGLGALCLPWLVGLCPCCFVLLPLSPLVCF